jgi:hypothetical protein
LLTIRHFLLGTAIILLTPALAKASECTNMGFSVNDYGKDGPARDAKLLLDKHIKAEFQKKGIKGYRTGPKSVSCKLFLDFGLFDEYTCVAKAKVCWGEGPAARQSAAPASGGVQKASEPAEAPKPVPVP